jgi:type III secretion protein L
MSHGGEARSRRGRVIRAAQLPSLAGDAELATTRAQGATASPSAPPLEQRRTRVLKQRDLDVRARAEGMLDQAQAQAAVIRERAEEDAAARARRLLDEARERAAAIAVEARAARARLLQQSEQQLTRLAVAIAEKLIGRALELEPQLIVEVVAQCAREAGPARRVAVRVNPRDVVAVRQAAPRLAALADAEVVRVEPDADVAPGGCVVQTDAGEIDGRLASQLAAIERALADGETP